MFHIDKTIQDLRFSLGYLRITDRLYAAIIKAGTIASIAKTKNHTVKLSGLNDDVYVRTNNSNGEVFLDLVID